MVDAEKSINDVLYSLKTSQSQSKWVLVKKRKASTVRSEKDVVVTKENRPILSSSEM